MDFICGFWTGGDSNTSKRLEGTPAEKHNIAAADSESKQERTIEQESHPVSLLPHLKIVAIMAVKQAQEASL
jgi:hypothetical protein